MSAPPGPTDWETAWANRALVQSIVTRCTKGHPASDYAELFMAGIEGAARAVGGYDPEHEHGHSLGAWMYPRIYGAVIDEIRRQSRASGYIRSCIGGVTSSRQVFVVGSLDAPIEGLDGMTLVDVIDGVKPPGEPFDVVIASLSPREREVLTASFVEDLSLDEIGEGLGVSGSRVCQIRSAALAKLREQISEPV